VARYEGIEEESLSKDKPNIHGGMATWTPLLRQI
jgi:hypothetical protein